MDGSGARQERQMTVRDMLFAAAGSSRALVTETFTSTTAWVAPSGVTSVLIVEGQGSDGTSDYWAPNSRIGFSNVLSTATAQTNNPVDWSTIKGEVNAMRTTLVNGGTGIRTYTRTDYTRDISSNGNIGARRTRNVASYTVRGSPGSVFAMGSAPSTGTPTYAQAQAAAGWQVSIETRFPGGAGSAASGFGNSFPGGTYSGDIGAVAPVTTFTNVPVTPGTSYTLKIPSGGYITLTY